MPVVLLKTIDLRGSAPKVVDTPIRSFKRRVFTEDQWKFLNTLSTKDLRKRWTRGGQLIGLLEHPAMMNMTQAQADMISSNLRYQRDAIMEIIEGRVRDGRG